MDENADQNAFLQAGSGDDSICSNFSDFGVEQYVGGSEKLGSVLEQEHEEPEEIDAGEEHGKDGESVNGEKEKEKEPSSRDRGPRKSPVKVRK